MTINLLESLEERMVTVLAKMDELRKDVHRLTDENAALKMEKETSMRKLQELIALLDTIGSTDTMTANAA